MEIEKEKENENEIEIEEESLSGERAFERFWEMYPIKIDRLTCLEIFDELEEPVDVIMKGLEGWLHSKQWRQDGSRFIPRPAKWLSEKHYLQTPEQAVPMGASGELGQAEIEAIHAMMRRDV